MFKISIFTVAAAAFLGSAAVAEQSTDTLSQSRLKAMSVAYERASANLDMDVDMLSPLRVAAMTNAYASHDTAPLVDAIGSAHLEMVRTTYRSHDAGRIGSAVFVGN